MKAWQQLIQSQTPNGLTAPSLGGPSAVTTTIAVNNKTEQASSSDGHQQSDVIDSRERRKSISSSSREGTPGQSSMVVGESITSKSSRPTTTTTTTATTTTTHSQTNASRTPTPTPTPSPRPPATPTSSSTSSSSTPSVPQVQTLVSAPQPAPVIPRPTKAQEFARNRIRRMQMLAQVTPQSHKPAQPQLPVSAAASATDSITIDNQKKLETTNKPQSGATNFQSLSSSQQQVLVTGTESSHSASLKATSSVLQSEHTSTTNSVPNGGHLKAISDSSNSSSYSSSSLSSAGNTKFMNTHSRTAPSLSQIVTNSFNHDPSPPAPPPSSSSTLAESHLFASPFSNSASQSTTIAHKIGVKGSQESNTGSRKVLLETPSPPESLLVRIPRNLVRVSRRNHEFHEAKGLHHTLGMESVWSSRHEDPCLTVSIDLSLLRRFSNSQQATNVKPNRTEWLTTGHRIPENKGPFSRSIGGDSEPMETEPIPSFGNGGIPHIPVNAITSFGNDRGGPHLPTLVSPGPKLVPSGASPGVDGCMGNDGYWYSWTDSIPGHEISVTVLPYIYVDDDESDIMEIFTN